MITATRVVLQVKILFVVASKKSWEWKMHESRSFSYLHKCELVMEYLF